MTEKFMDALQALRDRCAFPFIVTSAFRCPSHNASVGGSSGSLHLTGMAADIRIFGDQLGMLLQVLGPEFHGIGLYQALDKPMESRHIHLDVNPGPRRVWSG